MCAISHCDLKDIYSSDCSILWYLDIWCSYVTLVSSGSPCLSHRRIYNHHNTH